MKYSTVFNVYSNVISKQSESRVLNCLRNKFKTFLKHKNKIAWMHYTKESMKLTFDANTLGTDNIFELGLDTFFSINTSTNKIK